MQVKRARFPLKSVQLLHLILCLFASILILLISAKALNRAPWMDELMLYSNYPVESISASLHPLRLYDQAATPVYSLVYGWTAGLPTVFIRAFHLWTISFVSVVILSYREKTAKSVLLAAIIITSFPRSFYYMMEMKHYGLEIIGAMGVVSLFMAGNVSNMLRPSSTLIFLAFTFLGISTLPLGGVIGFALLGLVALRCRGLRRNQVISILTIVFVLMLYFLVIKNITVFQMANYPRSYSSLGFVGNARRVLSIVSSLVPGGNFGRLAMVGSFLILVVLSRDNSSLKRLCLVLVIVVPIYMILAGLGMYPAFSTRHVVWFSGLMWMLVYHSTIPFVAESALYIQSPDVLKRLMSIAAFSIAVFFSFQSFLSLNEISRNSTEQDTSLAIDYIRNHPTLKVGLYGAAQPMMDFYSKEYRDLRNRRVFGVLNSQSASALSGVPGSATEITVDAERPGAWARLWQRKSDYQQHFLETLDKAPEGEEFLLLAYWTGWLGQQDGGREHRLSGEELSIAEENDCSMLEHIDFGSADVYRVYCR